MDDLISRQAAIDAIRGAIFDFFDICDDDEESPMTYKDEQLLEINKAISGRIKQLPSAQQETNAYSNMSDEEFEEWLYKHGICNPDIHESIPCSVVPLLIDNAISELPFAQTQRMKGRWISRDGREDCYECSECHAVIESDEVYWRNNYFCYHCGADMRGEQ